MSIKDERIKCVNEVLSGMKVIKLYAYERPMEKMINDLRNKELALIKKAAFLNNISDMLNTASPFFVSLVVVKHHLAQFILGCCHNICHFLVCRSCQCLDSRDQFCFFDALQSAEKSNVYCCRAHFSNRPGLHK